jgi:pyruvate ferredoxin oxidoreductase gamma subunit
MIITMKRRINIRMSGLGGQGVVTSAHIMAMAASKEDKFAISNPFFGAEKRMAPAESYVRIGPEKIYDRGELVYPDVVMVFHPQVITMGKSYTMPFYSGIKKNGIVIINDDIELLTDNEKEELDQMGVLVYYVPATKMALDISGTELSTNMAMIGSVSGLTDVIGMEALDLALQDRFGKKYVASGGTATLDEAIKKKFAKKEMLLQKNLDTIKVAYDRAKDYAKSKNYIPAVMA